MKHAPQALDTIVERPPATLPGESWRYASDPAHEASKAVIPPVTEISGMLLACGERE